MGTIEVIRATSERQRAGAYAVRVQGMGREHHIALDEEFDEHDGDQSRYIVLTDDGYPVATCRFYEIDERCVVLGRVVVLGEMRGRHLGERVMQEAKLWVRELGYERIAIDARTVAVGFYERLGYVVDAHDLVKSGQFDCLRMHKDL